MDASEEDSGQDGGAVASCSAIATGAIERCTRTPSSEPIALQKLFAWPDPAEPAVTLVPSSIPLVANLTDDNGDGRFDLCDTPDVLVLGTDSDGAGALYLISGASGQLHRKFEARVASTVTPALADLDRDGDIEVVTFSPEGELLVLDALGTIVVMGDTASFWSFPALSCVAIAIADLDGDNEPEIIAGHDVFDRQGLIRFGYAGNIDALSSDSSACTAPIAANILGDSQLEVIFSPPAVQASTGELVSQATPIGSARVVETNATGLPELIIADGPTVTIVTESGEASTLILDDCASAAPAALDADDDGIFELVLGGCALRMVEILDQATVQPVWQSDLDGGPALITAFDLLGDGTAEIIAATASGLHVHDGTNGRVLTSRSDVQLADATFGGPVVADVNNDGSADVLLIADGESSPQLVVLSSATGSFAPTRRIYNQYAHQVTHIDERGMTIAHALPYPVSHQNAQIDSSGRICVP